MFGKNSSSFYERKTTMIISSKLVFLCLCPPVNDSVLTGLSFSTTIVIFITHKSQSLRGSAATGEGQQTLKKRMFAKIPDEMYCLQSETCHHHSLSHMIGGRYKQNLKSSRYSRCHHYGDNLGEGHICGSHVLAGH